MKRQNNSLDEFLTKDRIASLKEIWQVFAMGFKAAPLLNIIATILQFGQKLVAPLQIWISKLIIDAIVSLVSTGNASLDAKQHIVTLLFYEFGLMMLDRIAGLLGDWINQKKNYLYELYVQERIMRKALTLDMTYFDNTTFTTRYSYLGGNFAQTPAKTFDWLVSTATTVWGILVYIPMLLTLDTRVLFLAVLSPLVLYVLTFIFGPIYRQDREKRWIIERNAYYMADLAGSYEYAKEIRIFNLKNWIIHNYKKSERAVYTYLNSRRKFSLLDAATDFLLTQLSYYLAYAISIFDAIAGRITIGSLTMVVQSFRELRSQTSTLFRVFSLDLQKDIFQFAVFLNLEPLITEKKDARMLAPAEYQTLEMSDVSFSYQGGTSTALNNISLRLNRGDHVAFVGDNGSGKTTLVKLLLRLYDPTAGNVRVNGQDIQEYRQNDIWNLYSVIFQDFIRYRLTVEENIRMSDVHSDRRVQEAAELAAADEFIKTLPKKYKTLLNKRYLGDEEAHELSEGQWQKIALARAFYRDAPILILDEPTASVDAKTEYKLYKYFKDQARDKTLILISHHFSSVRFADHIYVLDKGRIIENGTHRELMQQNGKYAEMFNMQMEGLNEL